MVGTMTVPCLGCLHCFRCSGDCFTFAHAFLLLYAEEGKMRSDNEYDLIVYHGAPPMATPPGVNLPTTADGFRTDLTEVSELCVRRIAY